MKKYYVVVSLIAILFCFLVGCNPEVSLSSIKITAPTKTEYYEDDTLDLSGMVVTGVYSDGSEKEITTGYTVSIGTTQKLTSTDTSFTVSVGNISSEPVIITVTPISLVSVCITTNPDKTSYYEGDSLVTTGMVVSGTNNNGNTRTVTSDEFTVSITSALKSTDTSFTVSVGSITSDPVTITVYSLTTLSVSTTKNSYFEGDSIDKSTLTVTGTYSNGSSKKIESSEYSLSLSRALLITDTSFTISVGSITSDPVSISLSPLILTKIEINDNADTTVFYTDEKFNSEGLILKLTYNSGSTKEQDTGYSYYLKDDTSFSKDSVFKSSQIGTKTTVVSYTEKDVTKTIEYEITVRDRSKYTIPEKYTLFSKTYFPNTTTSAVTSIYFLTEKPESCSNGIKITGTEITCYENGTDWYIVADKIFANESCENLFKGFAKMKSINFSSFDTSNVTSMYDMFDLCENLVELDLRTFNTSNVTNMAGMFADCSSLKKLDLSSFDTSNVTDLRNLFSSCKSLTKLNLSNFNTSKVTDMASMFNSCINLIELNLSSFNTSNVTNMASMFYCCNNLKGLNLSNFDTSNVIYMGAMFHGCSSIKELDLSSFNTSNVVNMSSMFSGCSSLTDLNISNFDTSKVTIMYSMFSGCSGLTKLSLSTFNTSNVTSMNYMFRGCNSLTELNVSSFNTSKVTDMSGMFNNLSSLSELNLSNFDTLQVSEMYSMFNGCNNLAELDLSNFNTSNVTDMSYMFSYCSSLTELNVSNFDISNVTNMTAIFSNCKKLKTGSVLVKPGTLDTWESKSKVTGIFAEK